MSSIRVLVVDDDEVFREALREALRFLPVEHDDIEIVGEAGDGYTAIEMTRRLRPHVVMTDIDHPGPDGYAVTRAITEQTDGVKVLILSGYSWSPYVEQSWLAGANGFVAKGEPITVLRDAIKTVAGGGEFLSPELASTLRTTPRRPTPDW